MGATGGLPTSAPLALHTHPSKTHRLPQYKTNPTQPSELGTQRDPPSASPPIQNEAADRPVAPPHPRSATPTQRPEQNEPTASSPATGYCKLPTRQYKTKPKSVSICVPSVAKIS